MFYRFLCNSKKLALHSGAFGAAGAFAFFGGLSGCQSGDQRSPSEGSAIVGNVVVTEDVAPASTVPDGSKEGGSSSTGSGGGSEQFGKSLEQCTSEKKAWRAVVNSGSSPAECTDPLVSWCCTRKEVLARFPTMADKIDEQFNKYIDGEKEVLYHCSTGSDNRTTFHMAKIEGAQVFYRTVYVEQVFPVDTGHDNSDCPVITTDDLKVGSSSTTTTTTTTDDDDDDTTTDDTETTP